MAETENNLPPPSPQPLAGPRYVYVGFNATIDRNSIAKLLQLVGIIVEKRPRPKAIVLCLSSEGGMMEPAFYAYEILRSLPVGVATHNVGLVASAANVLFMAGNVRFASPRTSFLFHDTKMPFHAPGILSQQELQLNLTGLREWDVRTADIIAERINKPADEVRQWFGEEFRSAEFARDHGIIGDICPFITGDEDEFVQVVV